MKRKLFMIAILAIVGLSGFLYLKHNRQELLSDEITLYGNIDIRDVVLGFRQEGRIKELKVDEGDQVKAGDILATLDQDTFKQAVDLEHTVSKNNLKNAILNMDAQKENLELAERVYNTTKKKYEQGLGSTFEVLQADTEWQRAQGNYFDALYNAVVAKINYYQATGTLK